MAEAARRRRKKEEEEEDDADDDDDDIDPSLSLSGFVCVFLLLC